MPEALLARNHQTPVPVEQRPNRRALTRSLERVIGPDPVDPRVAPDDGMDVAGRARAYVASLQQVDMFWRLGLPLFWLHSNAYRGHQRHPLLAGPLGERCHQISAWGACRSLREVAMVVTQPVAHRNGTPPARGTQSQGLRTRRSPGCRIEPPDRFPVPSRTYPQGGVPRRRAMQDLDLHERSPP
jgi:hypothetical protein